MVKTKVFKFLLIATMVIAITAVIAGSIAFAAGITIQMATSKSKYSQGGTVTVRAVASNSSGVVVSSMIKSAKISIKNSAGKAIISGATMGKDPATGLSAYSYKLPSNAPKGTWIATVTIVDTAGRWGNSVRKFTIKPTIPNHSKFISSYEGPKTCIKCHSDEAHDMFSSVHYQWQGDPSKAIEIKNAGLKTSKLGGINDFCIWPDGNWLTIFNKTDGTKSPGGCATCHTGLGLKPVSTESQAQLENIDCLMCHGPSYSRKVVENPDATFKMAPADGVDILKVAQSVTRPTREMCMRCHEKSGGGDNYKRGDLESTIKNCTKDYDVHMGTNGANFACQDCHTTTNHKVAGRGSDMRALDSTTQLKCESCHTALPHRSTNKSYSDLNRHAKKLDCTVCHIPSFAKSIPTDMNRDWREMELDTSKKLYDPKITKQSNVSPTYAWFNGSSHFYVFKAPVSLDSRGVQKMSWPDGSFADSSSKLYPFKLHTAMQPMETTTKQLLPLKNKIAFETGDINTAIKQGAAAAGMSYSNHTFVPTERYLGIYHGVGPKSTALSCSNQSCHSGNRINFTKLGYSSRASASTLCGICHSKKTNPGFTKIHSIHRSETTRVCNTCHGLGAPLKESRATLCDNCHKAKSTTDAAKIHSKHVDDNGYDCSSCHTFSAGGLVSGDGDEGKGEEDGEHEDKKHGEEDKKSNEHADHDDD
ncbi:MAG: hypothetical protein HY779_02275 [Rubrobacteridae bacterium]|nr:hypothetical protein [Rubrobacteridae bacterium]